MPHIIESVMKLDPIFLIALFFVVSTASIERWDFKHLVIFSADFGKITFYYLMSGQEKKETLHRKFNIYKEYLVLINVLLEDGWLQKFKFRDVYTTMYHIITELDKIQSDLIGIGIHKGKIKEHSLYYVYVETGVKIIKCYWWRHRFHHDNIFKISLILNGIFEVNERIGESLQIFYKIERYEKYFAQNPSTMTNTFLIPWKEYVLWKKLPTISDQFVKIETKKETTYLMWVMEIMVFGLIKPYIKSFAAIQSIITEIHLRLKIVAKVNKTLKRIQKKLVLLNDY